MPTTEANASLSAAPATVQPERTPDPCIVVIFGASGDLTKRKLLPALYHLEQSGLLPKNFAVVGVARRPLETTFAADMKKTVSSLVAEWTKTTPKLAPFVDRIQYHAMNFDDASGYDALNTKLAELDEKFHTCGNRLFYLATAPEYFSDIINFTWPAIRPWPSLRQRDCTRRLQGSVESATIH